MPPNLAQWIPIYLGIAAILIGVGRMIQDLREIRKLAERVPELHERVVKIEVRHEMIDRAEDRPTTGGFRIVK